MDTSGAALRLAIELKNRGLSYRRAAQLFGCDHTTISKISSGSRKPGRRLALAIERLTADWEQGPIRASEWDVEEVPVDAPKPEAA